MPKDKKKRPSLGSGMAEKTAKTMEDRKSRRQRAMDQIFGKGTPNNESEKKKKKD